MEFILSFISSSLASSIVYPIDVIKTRYQVSGNHLNPQVSGNHLNHLNPPVSGNHPTSPFKSFYNSNIGQIIKNIYQTHGYRGYYRGLNSYIMTYPIFWAVYFQTNSYQFQLTESKYLNKTLNAFYSGAIASTIANPLFVLKVRRQAQSVQSNYFNQAKEIYYKEGPRSFFKGLPATVMSNSKLAVQFPLYDFLYEYNFGVFASSSIAKLASSTIFYPLDLIRTNQRNSDQKLSSKQLIKEIYQRNGVKGFYRGVGLYNLVTAPNFVLMMVIRDYIIKY